MAEHLGKFNGFINQSNLVDFTGTDMIRLIAATLFMATFAHDFVAVAQAGSLGRQRMMGISAGTSTSLTICSGYSCARRPRLNLAKRHLAYIDNAMAAVTSATEERAVIGDLIGWKERLAQKTFRLPQDNPKATGFDLGPGQMDCIDESTNTISFLQLLGARGLLKFHKISGYRDRGFVIDARLPHTTAVVKDHTGMAWAIDSWYRAGGEPPVIVPLSLWLKQNHRSY